MKKIMLRIGALLLAAGAFMFSFSGTASTGVAKKASCCHEGAACCYPGSPCCNE